MGAKHDIQTVPINSNNMRRRKERNVKPARLGAHKVSSITLLYALTPSTLPQIWRWMQYTPTPSLISGKHIRLTPPESGMLSLLTSRHAFRQANDHPQGDYAPNSVPDSAGFALARCQMPYSRMYMPVLLSWHSCCD